MPRRHRRNSGPAASNDSGVEGCGRRLSEGVQGHGGTGVCRREDGLLVQRNEDWEHDMKVLISWSGERSKHIALAVRKFLKLVIQATEPWVSEKDIAVGTFWHQELWDGLESAKAGVICLTREMLDSKW